MKKIMILFSLLLVFSTSFFSVEASDTKEIDSPRIQGRRKTEISYANINESDAFNNVVIFIKFADETLYSAPYGLSYYDDLFNGVDMVSLRDYYLEASYNQLTIDSYLTSDGTNIIFYQDVHDRSYYKLYDEVSNPDGYGAESGIDQSDREHALLKRAIDYVDDNNILGDSIDLDVNDDGDIDSITFMISGEDEGWNSLLWPHKWELSTYYDYYTGEYLDYAPTIDGLNAYFYTFELLGNNRSYDRQVDVGVLAHETFHLLSAPDLYHYYNYFHIEPIGDWGLMDNTSDIPSHMLGYMKEKYGEWIDVVDEITESGVYTLEPLADSGDNLYKVDLGYSNEYLYIEYRVEEGDYESQLPNSGLIVYRVDDDYFEYGNESGYYSNEGNPRDEVFVFRPGVNDVNYPIVFTEDGASFIDEDGDIDQAAISNNNYFKEMGIGTDIPMFYSDGTQMNVKILNVVEIDGSITFEIMLGGINPSIDLDSTYPISDASKLYLLDIAGLEYEAAINNIPDGALVYYTTDGTNPTIYSTLYDGEDFLIDADSNVIKAAIYLEGELFYSLTKEFDFVTEISTNHDPYGNNLDITWYIGLPDIRSTGSSFSLIFSELSELELDYDYLEVIYDSISTDYTGTVFPEETNYYGNVILRFTSDEWVDEYYGFSAELVLNYDASIELVGEDLITLEAGSGYTDAGAVVSGIDAGMFTVETDSDFDQFVTGDYYITFLLIDINGNTFDTVTRTITVVDTTPPELTMIGDSTIDIEVYGSYTDEGVSYTDNTSTNVIHEITGSVNFGLLGSYEITYKVTDSSGNYTTIIRTINIVDTTPPSISLFEGIDTIYVGEDFVDGDIAFEDNYTGDLEVTINGSVYSNIAGEYIIEYTVVDESLNSTTAYRYVNVLEKEKTVEFILTKTRNTVLSGEEFTAATCTIGGDYVDQSISCQTDTSNVRTSAAGTYEVIYYVVIDEVRYEYVSYVFVLYYNETMETYYDKSRRGYL